MFFLFFSVVGCSAGGETAVSRHETAVKKPEGKAKQDLDRLQLTCPRCFPRIMCMLAVACKGLSKGVRVFPRDEGSLVSFGIPLTWPQRQPGTPWDGVCSEVFLWTAWTTGTVVGQPEEVRSTFPVVSLGTASIDTPCSLFVHTA